MLKTILTLLLISQTSLILYAQEISDDDLNQKLIVELLSKEIVSKSEVRNVEFIELKYKCSVPLTFGVYEYKFSSMHLLPGIFFAINDEIILIMDYDYNNVFLKANELFVQNNVSYENRVIYLNEIFQVLGDRISKSHHGGVVIPDALFQNKN
ncbi:MAG: hypothetical protein ACFCU6_06885 [Balneolaceae bacterium]